MQKAILAWLLIPAIALALAACGGDGGGAQGGTVQSKVGNVTLGKALALELVTPVDTALFNSTPALVSPQNGDTWGGHVVKFNWVSVSDPRVVAYHLKVSEMGGTGPIYDITGLT